MTVPCEQAGKPLYLKVVSAGGPKDSYHVAAITLPVGYTDGECLAAAAKAKCAPAPAPKELDPAAAAAAAAAALPGAAGGIASFRDPSADAAGANADALADGSERALDSVQLQPVLTGLSREAAATLHGALMLAAFCVLLPGGALVARHRWMFGRDPRTGKVLSSWAWVHGGLQLLGVLCAAAGIIIAVLGCGWKTVRSSSLYEPHKIIGLIAFAMALVQLATSQMRPPGKDVAGKRGRGKWGLFHRALGRGAALLGLVNAFLGAVLMHSYRGAPLAGWLSPVAVLTGLAALAAVGLEAAKLQMQRTHRYNPDTDDMAEVFSTYHRSSKRAGDAADAAAAEARSKPVDLVSAAIAAENGASKALAGGAGAGAAAAAAAGAGSDDDDKRQQPARDQGAAAVAAAPPPPLAPADSLAVQAASAGGRGGAGAAAAAADYPTIDYTGGSAGNFAGRPN